VGGAGEVVEKGEVVQAPRSCVSRNLLRRRRHRCATDGSLNRAAVCLWAGWGITENQVRAVLTNEGPLLQEGLWGAADGLLRCGGARVTSPVSSQWPGRLSCEITRSGSTAVLPKISHCTQAFDCLLDESVRGRTSSKRN